MHIHIIAAALPPQVDGIGDYTAQLAAELAQSTSVTLLTSEGQPHASIVGATIEPIFSVQDPTSVRRIALRVEQSPPDWVLLQYNPFSYGRWGLNLHLPRVMHQIKHRCPGTKFALMVHEPFVQMLDWKHTLMTVWQRWQLWSLGHTADLVFFSTKVWADRFRSWFPTKTVSHLAVGSNIPLVPITSGEARRRLGIAKDTLVLGFFGTAHNARLLNWVRDAALFVSQIRPDTLVLYLGPHKETMAQLLKGIPLIADGTQPAEEISRRFPAADIFLSPFVDGISTRRTSLMTALQHGVAVVGTCGELTDEILSVQRNKAFLLADVNKMDDFNAHVLNLVKNDALRKSVGCEGRRLYEAEFAWERGAARLLNALQENSFLSQRKVKK